MPQAVIPGLISAASAAAVAAGPGVAQAVVFKAALKAFVVTTVLQLGSQILSPKPASGGGLADTSSGSLTASVGNAGWVLGEARSEGQVVWYAVQGRRLHQAIVLGQGPMQGITGIVFGGEQIPFQRGTGANANRLQSTGSTYTLDDGSPAVQVFEYFDADGTQGSQIRDIADRVPGALSWTQNHSLHGKSYALVTLNQNDFRNDPEERLWLSPPRMQFVMQGLKFASPNIDGSMSAVQWTDNPARIIWWWLTERRGIDPADIDPTYYNASLMLSDRNINSGDLDIPSDEVVKRYTINGTVSSGDSPASIESQMSAAMHGHIMYWDGRYIIRAGGERSRTLMIEQSDLMQPPSFNIGIGHEREANALTMTLGQSKRNNFTSSTVSVEDEPAQMAAGERLTQSPVSSSFINDPIVARNILTGYLAEQRADLGMTLQCMPGKTNDALDIVGIIPGDKVGVYLPRNGISELDDDGLQIGRAFVVVSNRLNEDLSVTLQLQEWPSDRFSDMLEPYADRQRVQVVRPQPTNPTGLTVNTEAVVERNHTGWNVEIEWDASPYRTRVEVAGPERTSFDVSGNNVKWQVSTRGTYTVTARHYASGERSSVATVRTFTVNPNPIEQPINQTIEASGNVARLIVPVTQANIKGAIVKQFVSPIGASAPPVVTDANWGIASRAKVDGIISDPTDDFVYVDVAVGVSAQYSFGLRLVDDFGQQTDTLSFSATPLRVPDFGAWSREYAPLFPGTHTQTCLWDIDERGNLLISSPGAAASTTRNEWNGSGGYPFGTPNHPSYWTSDPLQLGGQERDRVNVYINRILHHPPGVNEANHTPLMRVRKDSDTWQVWQGSPIIFTDATTLQVQLWFRGTVTYASHAAVRSLQLVAESV